MIDADRQQLRWRLHLLRQALLAVDPDAMREASASIDTGVDEPLRLGLVGRVKAGKSTLVNALIGRRVAPTDAAECTRIVTWYRFGAPDRAEGVLVDGRVIPVRGSDGAMLPDTLPVPLEQVSHAVVTVHEAALRDFTLIDTPGLGTTTTENEAATRRATLQRGQADALVYVFRDLDFADDVTFLQEFVAARGDRGGSAIDSIGVLSHADGFGAGPWADPDPVGRAAAFADRLAERRRAGLGAVVPVAGLLAEAAAAGGISERDAALLASLEGTDVEDLRDGFDLPPGVDPERIAELRRRISDFGVVRGRQHAARGAAALLGWARDVAGLPRLHDELRARYIGRHAQLRAVQALAALDLAADASPHRRELRDLIADARLDPDLHVLRELQAWEALRTSEPSSPLLAELARVIDSGDDRLTVGVPRAAGAEAVVAAAQEHAQRAQRASVFAALTAEQVAAQTLVTSYLRLAGRWQT